MTVVCQDRLGGANTRCDLHWEQGCLRLANQSTGLSGAGPSYSSSESTALDGPQTFAKQVKAYPLMSPLHSELKALSQSLR